MCYECERTQRQIVELRRCLRALILQKQILGEYTERLCDELENSRAEGRADGHVGNRSCAPEEIAA